MVSFALAGCRTHPAQAPAPAEAAEGERIAVTRWTEKTELFLEYPPLVAGQRGRFAVHLTNLDTFKPLATGRVTVELRRDDGAADSYSTDKPSRPGIFGVDVEPRQAGAPTMFIRVASEGVEDAHEVGRVAVHPTSEAAASAKTEQTEEESIAFLKEQQWTLEFATRRVSERSLRESLRVPAEVRARSGGEAEVTAPVSGRIEASSALPTLGHSVSRGQTLLHLVPPTPTPSDLASLELALAEANIALELVRKDRARVERLLAAGAIPARRLDESKAAESTAQARLTAAQARLAQHEASRRAEGDAPSPRFAVRAPISGVVTAVHVAAETNVEDGRALFRIVSLDPVYVVGQVPEADALRLRQVSGAEIEIPGLSQPIPAGRQVSTVRVVDPRTRTLSVIYEVQNGSRLLAVGQAVALRLFTSANRLAPVVPEAAIVDDGGRPVLFVQAGGESFARRAVTLGSREGGLVQVLEGVKAGERVVTRGAYLIRLAALSTQIPAHGHVH
jgi:RND family efflux transporter MFP subunit